MKTLKIVKCCAALGLLLMTAAPTSFAGEDSHMIQPGTPEAAKVTASLKHAAHIDRMNARGYTSGATSDRGMFYRKKADEIKPLLAKLQEGKAISEEDVHHALDNKHAYRYGSD
jgi:hypothetical protein